MPRNLKRERSKTRTLVLHSATKLFMEKWIFKYKN